MRFSIIIPVYNVEKYIRKCMDTVMNQTFRDFEVIVVDDESPDNSMQIVEEFAQQYPGMIKMIHQKNTRQGGARNRGVREARGEYLVFIDSDDYVRLDMLEVLDRSIYQSNCDILVFQFQMVSQSGRNLGEGGCGGLAPGVYAPQLDKCIFQLPANPANKVFRREFYVNSHVEFPEKLLYEDAVLRLLYAKASRIVISDEILYYYVQSDNSSIRRKPSEKMLDILTMSDLVMDMFRKESIYEDFREELDSALIGGIVYILDVINEADYKNTLQDQMVDYILRSFPEYEKYPCLDEDLKNGLKLLCRRQYRAYYHTVIIPRRIRRWLLNWKVIDDLNQLRKRIKKSLGNS